MDHGTAGYFERKKNLQNILIVYTDFRDFSTNSFETDDDIN